MSAYNYAKALFDLAEKENMIETINDEYDILYDAIKKNPDFLTIMSSPEKLHIKEEKLKKIASFTPLFIDFLLTLIKNQVMYDFKKIHKEWLKLTDDHLNIAYVKVYSALKLTDEKMAELESELKPYFGGKKINLSLRIDKNLIGGIKIEYRDNTLDKTIRSLIYEMKSTGEN